MRRSLLVPRLAVAILALVCLPADRVEAVVISTGDGSGNTTRPPDDPGWDNMAQLSNASAVYLGDRWMITANHVISSLGGTVGNSPITFTDGRVFDASVGSDVQINNSPALGLLTSPDLKMFRLAADPGLPALQIATASPAVGAAVMMIGAGKDREPNEIGWSVSSTFVWTPTTLPFATARGFALNPDSAHMRWGTNHVQTATSTADGVTALFGTQFSTTGNPFSAQAVTGDSGGGVFEFVGGSWRLAGIMDAMTSTIANEPIGNVVSGNDQSLIADLSQYRDQIEAVLNGPERLWQNQVNHFDVDHSGSVSARDVLLLINRLQANGTMTLSGTPSATDPLLDVNGDGLVSTLDLIQEINFLAGVTATPSLATSSSLSLVPEPSTAVLALLGILWIAIARRAASAKRKC